MVDMAKRYELSKQFHRIIYEEQPYTFLFQSVNLLLDASVALYHRRKGETLSPTSAPGTSSRTSRRLCSSTPPSASCS